MTPFCLGSLQAYIEFFITNWFLFYYTGILACLDGYMNIAMEQTEEHVNGQLKNKYGDPCSLHQHSEQTSNGQSLDPS
ncbi:hypothetical protein Bca52824_077978 [Brassica carinata]|uniref:LSM domain-containing protein n=2 Tax=Brassica TaxID=3705 RepID=A0A8X7Q041_BRACI|nr:hypothetical protein Bca52824_077978 [Brassica carinata]